MIHVTQLMQLIMGSSHYNNVSNKPTEIANFKFSVNQNQLE